MKYHMFGGLKSSQFQCVKNIQVAPRYRSIFHGPKEKLMSIGRYIAYRFLFYFSAYIYMYMYVYIYIYIYIYGDGSKPVLTIFGNYVRVPSRCQGFDT